MTQTPLSGSVAQPSWLDGPPSLLRSHAGAGRESVAMAHAGVGVAEEVGVRGGVGLVAALISRVSL